jgi:hypothetical protein
MKKRAKLHPPFIKARKCPSFTVIFKRLWTNISALVKILAKNFCGSYDMFVDYTYNCIDFDRGRNKDRTIDSDMDHDHDRHHDYRKREHNKVRTGGFKVRRNIGF